MVVNTDNTRERCAVQQATAVSPFLPSGSLGGALQSYSAYQTQSECRQQQQLLIDTLADVKTRAARAFGPQVPHDPEVPLKETYAGGGLYGLNCNYEVGFHGVVGKQRKSEDYVLHLALGPGLFAPFNDCTRACLACVLDGHGGTEAVAYVAERFPSYLLEDLPRLRTQPAAALVAALHRLDEELVAAGHNSGTTVNAVLLVDNALTIVNTGDCRAILYDWRDERAEQVTLDHNLSCAKERERVLGEGAELSTCGAYVVLPDPEGCMDGAKLLGVTKALGHASVKSFQRSASSISSLGLPGGLSGSLSGSLTGAASGLVQARSGATGASGALSSAASGGQGHGHGHGHGHGQGHGHGHSRVHWQLPAGHGGDEALGAHPVNSGARSVEEDDDAEAAGLFGLRPGALAAAVRAGFGSGVAKGGSSSNSSTDGREGQAVNGSQSMEMAFARSVSALPALRTTVPAPPSANPPAGMSRGASGGGPTPAAGEGYAPAASAGSSEVPTPLCSNGSSPAAPAAPSSPLAGATVFQVAGVAGPACGADAGGDAGDGGPGLVGAASQGPQFLLTCTPDVFERTIEDDRHLLLIGCDGVFDRMANNEACRTALRALSSSNSCQDAAREVTHRACRLGSGDNITALLLRFGRKPIVRRQSCSVLSLRCSSSNASNADLNGSGAHAGANGSGGGAGAVGASPSPSPSPSPMGGGTLSAALKL